MTVEKLKYTKEDVTKITNLIKTKADLLAKRKQGDNLNEQDKMFASFLYDAYRNQIDILEGRSGEKWERTAIIRTHLRQREASNDFKEVHSDILFGENLISTKNDVQTLKNLSRYNPYICVDKGYYDKIEDGVLYVVDAKTNTYIRKDQSILTTNGYFLKAKSYYTTSELEHLVQNIQSIKMEDLRNKFPEDTVMYLTALYTQKIRLFRQIYKQYTNGSSLTKRKLETVFGSNNFYLDPSNLTPTYRDYRKPYPLYSLNSLEDLKLVLKVEDLPVVSSTIRTTFDEVLHYQLPQKSGIRQNFARRLSFLKNQKDVYKSFMSLIKKKLEQTFTKWSAVMVLPQPLLKKFYCGDSDKVFSFETDYVGCRESNIFPDTLCIVATEHEKPFIQGLKQWCDIKKANDNTLRYKGLFMFTGFYQGAVNYSHVPTARPSFRTMDSTLYHQSTLAESGLVGVSAQGKLVSLAEYAGIDIKDAPVFDIAVPPFARTSWETYFDELLTEEQAKYLAPAVSRDSSTGVQSSPTRPVSASVSKHTRNNDGALMNYTAKVEDFKPSFKMTLEEKSFYEQSKPRLSAILSGSKDVLMNKKKTLYETYRDKIKPHLDAWHEAEKTFELCAKEIFVTSLQGTDDQVSVAIQRYLDFQSDIQAEVSDKLRNEMTNYLIKLENFENTNRTTKKPQLPVPYCPPYMGIEIEVQTKGQWRTLQGFSDTIRDIAESELGDNCLVKSDASVGSYGMEIVTIAATPKYHKDLLDRTFFKTNMNERFVTPASCGMHVHISRDCFTKASMGKFVAFINSADNKEFITKIAGRSANRYCQGITVKGKNKYGYDLGASIGRRIQHGRRIDLGVSKYGNVNLLNEHTVEVRMFKASVDRNTVFRRLEFCEALMKFCNQDTSVQEMTVYSFVNFVLNNQKNYPFLTKWLAAKNYINHYKKRVKGLRKLVHSYKVNNVPVPDTPFYSTVAKLHKAKTQQV